MSDLETVRRIRGRASTGIRQAADRTLSSNPNLPHDQIISRSFAQILNDQASGETWEQLDTVSDQTSNLDIEGDEDSDAARDADVIFAKGKIILHFVLAVHL